MLSPQWLDELRNRITLSSVIMRTTKLQKAGHEWKACCPFHDEKTPSFTVSDQKGFYHCFGCGAHGDVIRWMTDQRGLQFMDAVKELAAEAGMEVPAPDPRSAQRAEQRAGLHDVMQAAQDWFVRNLASNGGSGARDYLKSRGFNERTVERFGFGYAPAERQAMKAALSDFEEPMLIEGGLRIAVDEKEPYDRFRSRLMLPIHDARGRVIAFGGRILEADTKAPKYLNSPDTPLFDKGRTLYNLHRAGPVSRQSGRMIVVEGYMDVIALAAAGIEDVVAPLGTALTENQIELLWRMVEAPILCFDGDAAGQRAAMRAVTRALPMLRPQHTLQIVTLPPGLDPDDLLRKNGRGALDSVLENPTSVVDMLWLHERDAEPLDTPEAKAGLKARLLKHVETINHPDIKSLYKRDLEEKFSAYAFPPKKQYRKISGSRNSGANVVQLSDWGRSYISPELRNSWSKRDTKNRNRLGAALVEAVILRPDVLMEHIEYLNKLPQSLVDQRLWFLADQIDLDPADLDPERLRGLLRESDLPSPAVEDWDHLNFPFVGTKSDDAHARQSLAKAFRLYYGIPLTQSELDREIQNFADDEITESWAGRHAKLIKDLLDLKRDFDTFIRTEGAMAA
ncbi:MAG: DNA primase [Sphingomonadaceae bacterium]|nr:DNA primase [Sphingomonadaceae bacterium]